jgi:hypothetical protein
MFSDRWAEKNLESSKIRNPNYTINREADKSATTTSSSRKKPIVLKTNFHQSVISAKYIDGHKKR